jgi:hypothetical protein
MEKKNLKNHRFPVVTNLIIFDAAGDGPKINSRPFRLQLVETVWRFEVEHQLDNFDLV